MKYYHSVSNWCGRLILPSKNKRRHDGGVYFEVLQTPPSYSYLKGKKVWLTRDGQTVTYYWFDIARSVVEFDDDTRESIARNNVHPERLNGLRGISSLESLAGSRPKDDVIVELSKVRVVKDAECPKALLISREPVQISGTEYALVQFIKPINKKGDKYLVKHFNKKKSDFSGIEEKVKIKIPDIIPNLDRPLTSMKNIENNEFNNSGWYIYCTVDKKGNRTVQAIEPRDLLKVPTADTIIKKTKINYILKKKLFSNFKKYGHEKYNLILNQNKLSEDVWQIGDRALLLHIFGWRDGEKEYKLKEGQRVDGHFSLGDAEVFQDTITGDLRFNIIYRQVYCHNGEGVIAGAQKWHCYMGSLTRGFMFMVPVSDFIVKMPIFQKTLTNNSINNFINVLTFFLDKMTGKMRTGFGNGLSPVNPLTNCSQNTALAVYEAAYYIVKLKDYFPYLIDDIKEAEAMETYKAIQKISKKIMKMYSFNGNIPNFWKKYIKSYKLEPLDYKKHLVRDSIKSYKSIFPILHYKNLLNLLIKYSEGAVLIKTNFIGGEIDEYDPVMPTFKFKKENN